MEITEIIAAISSLITLVIGFMYTRKSGQVNDLKRDNEHLKQKSNYADKVIKIKEAEDKAIEEFTNATEEEIRSPDPNSRT